MGGYELQALQLATNQARRGAIAPILLTHAVGSLPLSERGPFGEIQRVAKGLRRHHPGAAWRELAGSIDIVHAHGLHKLCGQIVEAAAARGIPSVVKVPTAGNVTDFAAPGSALGPQDGEEAAPRDLRWRLMVATAWRKLRRASCFVAPTSEIERELKREGLRAEQLPNGVDTQRFVPPTPAQRSAARAELGLADNAFVAVSVARLATRKRHSLLLEAWATGLTQHPRARLLLVGNGPCRSALETRAARDDLVGRVQLLGERTDVRPALHAADVFLSAAEREGLPNALLEACAAGLPALASALAAHQGPGRLLVPRNEPEAWSEALRALADEPARLRELSRPARDGVLPLDIARVEQRVAELYARLLSERGARPTTAP
ncbi:MAG: D-inositol-3-phosphate glycosyltransferase [Planctomycetota bacterium]|nr:MAG: D-inositol-3-phosphate glycosyltransferase [Planctomycetota bacterium]